MVVRLRWTVLKGGIARPAAVLLLAVLLAGFGVTTLTRGWLWAAPYHDHIVLGGRHLGHGAPADGDRPHAAAHDTGAHGVPHHAHEGDELSRAFAALQTVDPAPATEPVGRRVVPTWSASAGQTDPGVFTFVATVAATLAGLAVLRGRRLLVVPDCWVAGWPPAPLAPPPRPV